MNPEQQKQPPTLQPQVVANPEPNKALKSAEKTGIIAIILAFASWPISILCLAGVFMGIKGIRKARALHHKPAFYLSITGLIFNLLMVYFWGSLFLSLIME